MSVIYIALPGALLLAGLALWGFIRAVKHGQYDDLDTPAVRMLNDDEPVSIERSRDEASRIHD